MQEQTKLYGAQFKKTKVISANLIGDKKEVWTSEGESFSSRVVILATGAMGRTNKLPGEDEFLGRGISYCATCDGAFFKNQDAAVFGSNEEALEEARFLTRFVKTLYFLTPKPKLEISPEIVNELNNMTKVKFLYGKRLVSIHGDKLVSHVVISDGKGEEQLFVKGVFIYTQGNKPIIDYFVPQADTASRMRNS